MNRRTDVPTYRELLARDDGPAGSSWGIFGRDHQVAMVASDNAGVEGFPVRRDSGFWDPAEPVPSRGPIHNGMLHRPLIALLGLLLGELWRLDELATACADDGRYEFLLTAKPLALVGGVGSPANAMAVK